MKSIKSPLSLLQLDSKLLGKIIYLFFFYTLKFFYFLKFQKNLLVWPRNSLFHNYFGFLKSDLDITFLFLDQKNFIEHAILSKSFLKYFPLIKEANYYSFRDLNRVSCLINSFELKRDPILLELVSDFNKIEKSKAEPIIYLLRTFLSNHLGFLQPTKRDLIKWRYHLTLSCLPLNDKTKPILCLKEALQIYFNSNHYFDALMDYFDKKNQNIPDHLNFDQNPSPKELFVIFPHMFTYKEIAYTWDFSENEIECIMAQISWEIWAMYTQIDMHLTKNQSQQHFSNISRFLKHLHTKYPRKLIDEMIVSIDEWLRL